MQINCLDQDLRVPDLRSHELSTNCDFLKESTADQTLLIDEWEILEKRYRGIYWQTPENFFYFCLSRSIDLAMQNPSEDTEWNDALRRHGILPQKESEVTEDQLINMVEETVQKRTGMNVVKAYEDMTLDELEELEDEEDERVLLQYR